MPDSPDVETRLSNLEARMEVVAADAAAARRLAAGIDQDHADHSTRIEALRNALNGHAVQTAARFDRLEQKVDNGFAEMRAKHDQTAAGLQRIVDLITGIERGDNR